jgi:hypothetical protein
MPGFDYWTVFSLRGRGWAGGENARPRRSRQNKLCSGRYAEFASGRDDLDQSCRLIDLFLLVDRFQYLGRRHSVYIIFKVFIQ